MTQTKAIEKHLRAGKTLTALSALKLFNCLRLSGRVKEIRDKGVDVRTEMISVGKKRIARYYVLGD